MGVEENSLESNQMIQWLKGSVCLIGAILIGFAASLPILLLAVAKFLTPIDGIKSACTDLAILIAEGWVDINKRFYFFIHKPHWQVTGLDGLSRDQWYLIISNHQSWTDIAVLVFLLNGRTSFLKFFLKQELIWLPFVGIACWVLEFPFMKRHSKEEIERNPTLRTQDLETTRKFCEKLRHNPASVINYLEGTRFTPEKQRKQASPYRYLLKPKSGGIAYVIGNVGDQLDRLLDMTIVYKGGRKDFFGFLCGQIDPIIVDINSREIPESILQGEYQESDEFRANFQSWVAEIWSEKDALIAKHLNEPEIES